MQPIDIITFILDEDVTVENFVNQFLHEEASFMVSRFDNPDKFRQAVQANEDVRLVLLDVELAQFKDYRLLDMIKYLHKERSGTYIIIVARFDRSDPDSFGLIKEFVRIGVFDLVDKQDQSWKTDLQGALTRVTAKILFKLNLTKTYA